MTTETTEHRPPGVYPRFPDSLTDWATYEREIDWEVVPFSLGPTWDRNPFWDGPRDPEGYILPKITLGWQVLKWIRENLLADETDEHGNKVPFSLTAEQARFILWFYALDVGEYDGDGHAIVEPTGRFMYREYVLQRLKGHGKDPLAAVIAAVEFVGPCRFAGWSARNRPDLDIIQGDPVAKPHPRAWIQIAAVSLEQPLALTQRVRTTAGWKTVGELTVGDYVFDEHGQPQRVERETEVMHDLECLEVLFDDGQSVVASAGHGWTVDRASRHDGFTYETLTATTEDLMRAHLQGRRQRIPNARIETPDINLPIDPYLLGLWLADGSVNSSTIAIDHSRRDEIEQIVRGTLRSTETLTFAHHGGNWGTMTVRNTSRHASNGPALRTRLRDLGVLNDKHVPNSYLQAGTEQRRALLQGLLDGDGHIDGAAVGFTNTRKPLAEAVLELSRSLGYKPRMRRRSDGAAWIVRFTPDETPVFRMQHKVERQTPSTTISTCRFIRAVRKVDSVPVKCIGIDTPSHLFQVEGGIVTQNTKNTMLLFNGIFSAKCIAEHNIDIGKTVVYAYGGQKRIEAVTSSPASLEGNRPTLVIKNEALTLDTPIPAPSGWTTMGELRDGDVIYGADGQPTRVTKAHEVQHGRRVFEVVFNTGDVIKASDGHWWKVRLANNPACTLHEMTTLEMFEAGREFFPPRLPVTGVDFEEKDLPIDPYILGLWLGDGSKDRPEIASSAEDIDETLSEIQRLGFPFAKKHSSRQMHILISSRNGKGRGVGSLKQILRDEGLLGNKHIPESYMTASLEQRLALLQGLFDSDGSIRDGGEARFCNANTTMMDRVRELLLSVGYDARRPVYQTRAVEKWPDRAHWQPTGTIGVVAHAERPLFRLARKAAKMRPGMPDSRVRKIVEIREIASEPVRCISVAAEDKLFMAGKDYQVTRNTHHWKANNDGVAMAEAIERNATKAKGGAARTLSITNAYEPSQESVARDEREAYEKQLAGEAMKTGALYDTLEAPKTARLRPLFPDEMQGAEERGIAPLDDETKERLTRLYIRRVLEAVRGGAWWLDIPNLTDSILKGKVSLSRRFWYNQIAANEDAWVHPDAIDAAIDPKVAELRRSVSDPRLILEAGWQPVGPGDQIVAFFDGSKSDDSTAIVGCRLSDGYTFLIGVWSKPKGEKGKKWLAPRNAVSARVKEMFERFNVVAFWGDPSHAKDDANDEGDASYWMPSLDMWMREYKNKPDGTPRLLPQHWPVKTGLRTHAINWDMTSADRTKAFLSASEQAIADFENLNDIEDFEPTITICGHPVMVQHLKNAIERADPRGWGIGLSKEQKDSPRKIDIAVCVVGARMLRRIVLNADVEEETEEDWGEIW